MSNGDRATRIDITVDTTKEVPTATITLDKSLRMMPANRLTVNVMR